MRAKALTLIMALILILALASQAEARQVFKDDFNGVKVNAGKWNTSIATSGERWCSSAVADISNPGQWLDVSVESCHGLTQTPPFGAIGVGDGQISFSQSAARAFPYIWRGPPSKKSPFPETGDFVFEARIRYDSLQSHGSGLEAVAWNNTEPSGDNPPLPFGGNIFHIWAETGGGLHLGFLDEPLIALSDPLAYHNYRVEYVDGSYSIFVDEVLKAGPTASDVRPNTIWIGNPVFTFWGSLDWSDFTIDYVRVRTL